MTNWVCRRAIMAAMQARTNGGACHTSGCHGSSYLVCQCESGLGESSETLHLKLHLTDRRVKADAATPTHTNRRVTLCMQLIHQSHNSQQKHSQSVAGGVCRDKSKSLCLAAHLCWGGQACSPTWAGGSVDSGCSSGSVEGRGLTGAQPAGETGRAGVPMRGTLTRRRKRRSVPRCWLARRRWSRPIWLERWASCRSSAGCWRLCWCWGGLLLYWNQSCKDKSTWGGKGKTEECLWFASAGSSAVTTVHCWKINFFPSIQTEAQTADLKLNILHHSELFDLFALFGFSCMRTKFSSASKNFSTSEIWALTVL